MVWERNGPFTDTAKMTEGTNPHNGTIQWADFRLIHPALLRSYQKTTKTTRQPRRKEGQLHKEHKNLILMERTRESHEQPGL